MSVCYFYFMQVYIKLIVASTVCLPQYQGIQQLLASLENLTPMLKGRDDDLQFLRDMLQSNEFHSLMTVSLYGNINIHPT